MNKPTRTPKLRKFSLSFADTEETIAVVEGTDADDALTRFLTIRRVLRRQLIPDPEKIWKIEQLAAKSPVPYPYFSGTFFDILEASEAIKH